MFGFVRKFFKRAVAQSPFYVAGGSVFASESVDSALESVATLFERVANEVVFRVTTAGMPDPTHKISGLLLGSVKGYEPRSILFPHNTQFDNGRKRLCKNRPGK